ncbi:MAG: hypothetical protein HY269_01805 [Deltaproteobacteria bacterium]|nr:hypothetical protein [Deltaproteobacteria bacterium]
MPKPSFLFGTVGAPISTPKKPGGSVGAIQHSASMELYALELGWVRSINVTEATCAAIKAAAVEPRLRDFVKELRDNGNPVTLRPETMGKIAMLGSFEDTLEMSTEVEGVQPCIDFAHLHARPGDGSVNSYAEWDALLKKLKKKLGASALKNMHIHLSGIEYGPKGEKKHLPFADADLKYKALFKALADHKCSGRILCESPKMEDDAVLLMKAWDKIAK